MACGSWIDILDEAATTSGHVRRIVDLPPYQIRARGLSLTLSAGRSTVLIKAAPMAVRADAGPIGILVRPGNSIVTVRPLPQRRVDVASHGLSLRAGVCVTRVDMPTRHVDALSLGLSVTPGASQPKKRGFVSAWKLDDITPMARRWRLGECHPSE